MRKKKIQGNEDFDGRRGGELITLGSTSFASSGLGAIPS